MARSRGRWFRWVLFQGIPSIFPKGHLWWCGFVWFLSCSWVGSLDFNCLGNEGISTTAAKSGPLLSRGINSNQSRGVFLWGGPRKGNGAHPTGFRENGRRAVVGLDLTAEAASLEANAVQHIQSPQNQLSLLFFFFFLFFFPLTRQKKR